MLLNRKVGYKVDYDYKSGAWIDKQGFIRAVSDDLSVYVVEEEEEGFFDVVSKYEIDKFLDSREDRTVSEVSKEERSQINEGVDSKEVDFDEDSYYYNLDKIIDNLGKRIMNENAYLVNTDYECDDYMESGVFVPVDYIKDTIEYLKGLKKISKNLDNIK